MKSTRSRLALLFTALTGVILGVFCASLFMWFVDRADAEIERHLHAQASMLSASFLEELEEVKRGVHPDLTGPLDMFCERGKALVEIRDTEGRPLYRRAGFEPLIEGDRLSAVAHGVRYRGLVLPVTAADGTTYRLMIAVDEEYVHRQREQLLSYYIQFCPLMLALAWLMGLLFVGRALAPVEQMRAQAERISRENVSERIPEPSSTGELRNLARTLNEMLDRLDRAFQDLQQFAADAAHELRTPLANLRAQIETVIQEEDLTAEYAHTLSSISEDVARMNRVVADLFTLAKVDMRQYALQREPVSLMPLLREALETWQATAKARGIAMDLRGADVAVAGDSAALRRVFMNLVENAIKYNREGGTIDIALENADGRARVRISDTGIGIAPEHLPNLFRRFYRIDSARSRDTGGAGLGLAICKSFVEAHEGKISVQSVPDRGTTFTVELAALPTRSEAPVLAS